MNTNSTLLDVPSLADEFAIAPSMQKRLRSEGVLPFIRLGHRTIRYFRADVEAALKRLRVGDRKGAAT